MENPIKMLISALVTRRDGGLSVYVTDHYGFTARYDGRDLGELAERVGMSLSFSRISISVIVDILASNLAKYE